MDVHQAFRSMSRTNRAASTDYLMSAQDEQASFCMDAMQISANAESQWRKAYDSYVQEMRAASSGDDAAPRASVAIRNLQKEYGRIHTEYVKACEDRYTRMSDAVRALSEDVRTKMLDRWIDYLREAREAIASSGGTAAHKKSGS